jgi:ribose/xylose/arabinose/galactoside ABC-type transport system permease subunit
MSQATPTPTPSAEMSAPSASRNFVRNFFNPERPYAIFSALLVLIVFFSITSPVFFSGDNFANIGRQTALVTIMAVGVTFVIISAEIDLSVASVLALAGVMSAMSMQVVNSWFVGGLVGLATGTLFGLLSGVLTTRFAIPSFLVTLGMLGVARGLAYVVTDTAPVLISNETYFNVFGEGDLFGIPAPIVWTIVVLILGGVLLHFTTFGRKVFATGGNATAARYSGINTSRVKITAFMITGCLAGLAGLILSARGHAARPDIGIGLELDVIAAVILGGTSLFGGRGAIIGTLIGSLIIGVMNNGLVIVGVSSSWQIAVKGAIIILAVAAMKKK